MEYLFKIRVEYWENLLKTYEYYNSINESLGRRFYHETDKALQKIKESPELFQIRYKRYRQVLVNVFPYLIIFELIDKEIIVYTIFPAKSNPAKKPN